MTRLLQSVGLALVLGASLTLSAQQRSAPVKEPHPATPAGAREFLKEVDREHVRAIIGKPYDLQAIVDAVKKALTK